MRLTFLAVLLPMLALAVVLANWLMWREARRLLPDGTKLERAHFMVRAWSTASLSLVTEGRNAKPTTEDPHLPEHGFEYEAWHFADQKINEQHDRTGDPRICQDCIHVNPWRD